MIENLNILFDEMEESIFSYDIKEFNDKFILFITTLMEYLSKFDEDKKDLINNKLLLINDAFINKDYVFVLDIIHYELIPSFAKFENN